MTHPTQKRIGKMVQEVLDAHGLTQQEAADRMGTTRYSVNQIVNGRRGLTAAMALRLEAAFPDGLSAEDWLAFQVSADLAEARANLEAADA